MPFTIPDVENPIVALLSLEKRHLPPHLQYLKEASARWDGPIGATIDLMLKMTMGPKVEREGKVEELKLCLEKRGQTLFLTDDGIPASDLLKCMAGKLKETNGKLEALSQPIVEVETPKPSRPMNRKSPLVFRG